MTPDQILMAFAVVAFAFGVACVEVAIEDGKGGA